MSYNDWLQHHGIPGMKWGVMHGPPYPLGKEVTLKLKREKFNGKEIYLPRTNKKVNTLNLSGQTVEDASNKLKSQLELIGSKEAEFYEELNKVYSNYNKAVRSLPPDSILSNKYHDNLLYEINKSIIDQHFDDSVSTGVRNAFLYETVQEVMLKAIRGEYGNISNGNLTETNSDINKIRDKYMKIAESESKKIMGELSDKTLEELNWLGEDKHLWVVDKSSSGGVNIPFSVGLFMYNEKGEKEVASSVAKATLKIKSGSPHGPHEHGIWLTDSNENYELIDTLISKYEENFKKIYNKDF